MHDDASIPAKLQNNFFLAGMSLDLPSHRRAARKTDQLDAVVSHQQPGIGIR